MKEGQRTSAAGTVSVIIPCRNSTGTLGMQLEALASQVDAPAFEVIIADNGSTDGLTDFVAAWRDRLVLTVVDAAGRPGAAYARNVGISAAKGEKLLFCDSDDIVARDWVARANDALNHAGVFSGPGVSIPSVEIGDQLDPLWERLDAEQPPTTEVTDRAWAAWPIILGGNSGMRREIALAVGGYDAGLAGYVEDNDLAIRLQDAGYPIASAPGVRILYRARSGSRAAFTTALRSGRAIVALCVQHDMVERSPILAGRRWVVEPLRVMGSAGRMALRSGPRDVEGLAFRAGLSVGVYSGWIRHIVRRIRPRPAVGLGLLHPAGETQPR